MDQRPEGAAGTFAETAGLVLVLPVPSAGWADCIPALSLPNPDCSAGDSAGRASEGAAECDFFR